MEYDILLKNAEAKKRSIFFMKKFTGAVIAALCMVSLTACGSKKPSLEEVEKSIAEGNVTVEDALEKGWVTQEWVDDYYLSLIHI